MSAASRCQSCACCGLPLCENDLVSVEPVIELDAPVRYVAVLWGHTTFSPVKAVHGLARGLQTASEGLQ